MEQKTKKLIPENVDEYDQTDLAKRVVGVIPAGGSGFRSTPMWTRFDAFLDTIAKPAMRDLFWRRPYLDIIFDYLIQGGVVEKVLLSVGEKPKESREACKTDRDKIVYQAYVDMKRLVDRRGGSVEIFFDNPGGDKGTGATAVAEEGKQILRQKSQVDYILVCFGDVPTIPTDDFKRVVIEHVKSEREFTLISSVAGDPFNYGRVVRYPKTVLGILPRREVEQMKVNRLSRLSGISVTKEDIDKFEGLNQSIRDGELIVVRLPKVDAVRGNISNGVDTTTHGEWAGYLFLEGAEYQKLKSGEKITLYHPKRECLKGGKITLTKEEIKERRLSLKEDETIIWDPRTDEFFDIKEQGDIGRTAEQREKVGSMEVEGIEYPLSTDYLHAITERNTGLVVMNKEIMLRTIRDIDAPNYGRVVEDEAGNQIATIPNEKIAQMGPEDILTINGKKFSKQELERIRKCKRLWETDERVYVLDRHPNGEYYLPEIAKEVRKKGESVNLCTLFGGIGEGYDFRTDTRLGAIFENAVFTRNLQERGAKVTPGTRFWVGGGFDIRHIEPGVSFEGDIALQGDIRIRSGASLKDAAIHNYYYNEYDSPNRKQRVRGGRRGLDYLVVGENARLEDTLVVNGNVGPGGAVRSADVVGVDVAENERIEDVVVRIGRDGSLIKIPKKHKSPPLSYSGLEELDLREEGKMLEHVYAVTIRPESQIFTTQRAKEFLKVLAEAVEEFGGAKAFCKAHIEELKAQRPSAIPGFEDFVDLNFYMGANTVLGGKVGLAGDIYIDGWASIHNSIIRDSKVGRNARIADSLVETSRVESSPKAVTIIDSVVVRDQQIKEGSIMDFSTLSAGIAEKAREIFPDVPKEEALTACVAPDNTIVAIRGTDDEDLLEYLQRYSPEVWAGITEIKGTGNILIDIEREEIRTGAQRIRRKEVRWLIEAVRLVSGFPRRKVEVSSRDVAVILGAGNGVRMGAAERQKISYPVGSRPAINRAIDIYKRCGLKDQIVVVGYLGHQVVEQVYKEHSDIIFACQARRLGTGHAAKQAAYLLKVQGYNGDILVVAGDKVIDLEVIRRFQKEFKESGADTAVLVAPKSRWPNGGRIVCKKDGSLDSIVEKSDITRKILFEEILNEKQADENFSNREILEMIRKVVPDDRKASTMIGEELWSKLQECGQGRDLTFAELEEMIGERDLTFTITEKDGSITRLNGYELEKRAQRVNTSVYLFKAGAYYYALGKLSSDNAQREEYLTDAIAILGNALDEDGRHRFKVIAVEVEDPDQVLAFNTPEELEATEETIQGRVRRILNERGVTQMGNFENSWIDDVDSVWKIGEGTVLLGSVFIDLGKDPKMKIGKKCHILGEVTIINSALGDRCTVENSKLENMVAGDEVIIRGFVLTPQKLTVIPPGVEVAYGNMSELDRVRDEQRQLLKKLRTMYLEAAEKGQLDRDAEYYMGRVDETNVYIDPEMVEELVSSGTRLSPGDIFSSKSSA